MGQFCLSTSVGMSSQVEEWQHQVGFLSWELFPRSYICLGISVELSKCMHAMPCSAVPDSLRAVLFWGELEIWEEIRTWFWNQKCAEVLLLIVHKPACLFWAIWKLFSLFSLLAIFYLSFSPIALCVWIFSALKLLLMGVEGISESLVIPEILLAL